MELFRHKGYNSVGINEICNTAGIRPGSFYYYFPSKRELAVASLDLNWTIIENEIMKPAFEKNMSPRGRIIRFFNIVYKYYYKYKLDHKQISGCTFGSIGSEVCQYDELIKTKINEVFDKFISYFTDTLVEAVSSGTLNMSDIHEAATSLFAYYEGVLLIAKTHNDPEVIRQLTPSALHLIGIGKAAPTL